MRARVSALLTFLSVGLSGCGSGGSGGKTVPPPATYTISGFVNNLLNSPITLRDNGGDSVTLPTFGPFTFPTPLASGATYNVTIARQPTNGQTCAMQNGTGTVTANVTSVLVNCYSPMAIGGSVYGLSGSGLALQNNGSETLSIASDGTFQFSSTLNFGQSYDVTVSMQPTNPAQLCTVTNGTGAPQGNVVDILVSCGSAAAKWTWMGGSQSTALSGVYGQQGVAAPSNNPGARGGEVGWTDPSGNFWLFGGSISSLGNNLNDLWKYSSGEWTWISGSSTGNNAQGAYGTQGTPSPSNVPGGESKVSRGRIPRAIYGCLEATDQIRPASTGIMTCGVSQIISGPGSADRASRTNPRYTALSDRPPQATFLELEMERWVGSMPVTISGFLAETTSSFTPMVEALAIKMTYGSSMAASGPGSLAPTILRQRSPASMEC